MDGQVVARFDLAYPDAKIAIEFVSWQHHHGRQAWRHDVGRLNRVVAEGWLVFQLTEEDIADGCRGAAARIERAYRMRTAA